MFHIDFLPDDCLCLVLDLCTLQQLIHLRAICTRWCVVIERMLHRRRSLRIFESFKDLEEFFAMRYYFLTDNRDYRRNTVFVHGDNILVIDSNDSQILLNLSRLFPNLQELLLLYSQSFVQSLFVSKVPAHLHSLTLVSKKRSGLIPTRTWQWINSLGSLRRLSLFGMYDYLIPQLSIISQLEHFSLNGYSGDIVPVLSQLGPSLSHLYLDRLEFPLERLRTHLGTMPQFYQNVTHLSVGSLNTGMVSHKCYVEKIQLFAKFFCEHFKALTSLHLRFALQIPLHELISSLSHLPHLHTLRLAQIGSSHPNDDPTKLFSCAPLRSVKSLCLESTYTNTLDHFWKQWIPVLFPNLEHFQVQSEGFTSRSMANSKGTQPHSEIMCNRINYVRIQ